MNTGEPTSSGVQTNALENRLAARNHVSTSGDRSASGSGITRESRKYVYGTRGIPARCHLMSRESSPLSLLNVVVKKRGFIYWIRSCKFVSFFEKDGVGGKEWKDGMLDKSIKYYNTLYFVVNVILEYHNYL